MSKDLDTMDGTRRLVVYFACCVTDHDPQDTLISVGKNGQHGLFNTLRLMLPEVTFPESKHPFVWMFCEDMPTN
jgi:hypothetical protein